MKTNSILSILTATVLMSAVVGCNQSDQPLNAGGEPVPSVADAVKNEEVPVVPEAPEEIPPQVKTDDGEDENLDKEKENIEAKDGGDEPLKFYGGFEVQPTFPPSVYKAMQDLISDDDGDGVINMHDKCAGTEKGWVVDGKGCSLTLQVIVKPEMTYYGALYDAAKESANGPKVFSHKYLPYDQGELFSVMNVVIDKPIKPGFSYVKAFEAKASDGTIVYPVTCLPTAKSSYTILRVMFPKLQSGQAYEFKVVKGHIQDLDGNVMSQDEIWTDTITD